MVNKKITFRLPKDEFVLGIAADDRTLVPPKANPSKAKTGKKAQDKAKKAVTNKTD